jgi:hypothetical protein
MSSSLSLGRTPIIVSSVKNSPDAGRTSLSVRFSSTAEVSTWISSATDAAATVLLKVSPDQYVSLLLQHSLEQNA